MLGLAWRKRSGPRPLLCSPAVAVREWSCLENARASGLILANRLCVETLDVDETRMDARVIPLCTVGSYNATEWHGVESRRPPPPLGDPFRKWVPPVVARSNKRRVYTERDSRPSSRWPRMRSSLLTTVDESVCLMPPRSA